MPLHPLIRRGSLLVILLCAPLGASAAPVSARAGRTYLVDRAHKLFDARPAAERRQLVAILRDTRSKAERGYLLQQIALGEQVAAIQSLADEIRGASPETLATRLHLAAHTAGGRGLKQCFGNTCQATVTQALRAELDPGYAARTRAANPALREVSDSDPWHFSPGVADEQKALFDRPPNQSRRLGPVDTLAPLRLESGYAARMQSEPRVVRPRDRGGLGRISEDLINEVAAPAGIAYRPMRMPVRTLLARMERSLSQGLPVLLRVSDDRFVKIGAHEVLALSVAPAISPSGKPTKDYLIYDPLEGVTKQVSRRTALADKLDLSGWKLITHALIPETIEEAPSN